MEENKTSLQVAVKILILAVFKTLVALHEIMIAQGHFVITL